MSKSYSKSKKKQLAARISSITDEADLIRLVQIMAEDEAVDDSTNVHASARSVHKYFHKYTVETYQRLDKELKRIAKRNSETETDTLEIQIHTPYTEDEFPSDKNVATKLKLSNKEKNLIKRRRYITAMTEQESESDITYTPFEAAVTSSETQPKSRKKRTSVTSTA